MKSSLLLNFHDRKTIKIKVSVMIKKFEFFGNGILWNILQNGILANEPQSRGPEPYMTIVYSQR